MIYIIHYTFIIELFITNKITRFSYRSNLTIRNITNKYDGEYVCIIFKSNKQNVVKKSYSLTVKSKYFPKIKII